MPQIDGHTFYIPVMGTGFTIDTPLKVAKYGISSVISLVDDTLIEQMRKFYCEKFGETYAPILKNTPDSRARRITAYLDFIDRHVRLQFAQLKGAGFGSGSDLHTYFHYLPPTSPLKALYHKMMAEPDGTGKHRMQTELVDRMEMGSIDVNIMTKLDAVSVDQHNTVLPHEFSEALANLRGYAQSSLRSAIVLSAGVNQRLFTYMEQFKDFYADATGTIKKKIILKVSDFRSSIIQGKIFAKKGLWISEFRFESGLNCGGHAFSSCGQLLGPILEEFKSKKDEMIAQLQKIYQGGLEAKNLPVPETFPAVKVTAQGGIGSASEDRFLKEYYAIDATGWGSPFLLCPEAVNVDEDTLKKLCAATEEDLYLSDSSPLGVPFNNLRNCSSEEEKRRRISDGKPGATCIKGSLRLNDEFGKLLCRASKEYQDLKIHQIKTQGLSPDEYAHAVSKVTAKACICHQLGNGVLDKYGIIPHGSQPVAVCPGPNLAFFSTPMTLREIIAHIYGEANHLNGLPRLNMFLQELRINIDFLAEEIREVLDTLDPKAVKYFQQFHENLTAGIEYYRDLFSTARTHAQCFGDQALEQLDALCERLQAVVGNYPAAFAKAAA